MKNLKIDLSKIYSFVDKSVIEELITVSANKVKDLENKTGEGKDFLGWVDLPSRIKEDEILEIEKVAESFKHNVDYVVVIGIGGSYLGSKAVVDALSNNFSDFDDNTKHPKIIFAGQNISEDYMYELLSFLDRKSFGVVVISKSGTTTEPALAFRFVKNLIEKKYGKLGAQKRIVAITDKEKGALRHLADNENYKTFVIPDNIGGRYSVLTPVGLLPIAIAGFDIRELIAGAKIMEHETNSETKPLNNQALVYAAARTLLYKANKTNEILVNYNPKLQYVAEWWKQLFGESDGKENKGIFPASVNFTSDLHSMGQYIQEGLRNIFETTISISNTNHCLTIPVDTDNLDNLNYLAGKNIDEVNKMAELGTLIAHIDGGVPNIKIEIEKLDEINLGQLIYFFEKSCAIGGYMLGINPFNQPGVEAYKKNMFALLEKPGFEKEYKDMLKRL